MGESGHFYVMCNFGKINVWALFDTGASATVVNQSFADEHPELFDIISMDTGMDWTGTEHEAQIVSVKNLSLDSICFEEHEAGILDLSNAKKYLESSIKIPCIIQPPVQSVHLYIFRFQIIYPNPYKLGMLCSDY